jgi:uncharacterized membrane protein YphA (DoxX/SURF4 family)
MMVDARDTPGRKTFSAIDVGLLLGRAPIGLVFALAGIMKIKGGIGEFVNKAGGAIPGFLPHSLGVAYLHALPFAELLVGIMLFFGVFTRFAALIASLLLLSFIIAVTGIHRLPNMGPIHFNVVYLGLTLLLACAGGGFISVDGMLLNKRTRLI